MKHALLLLLLPVFTLTSSCVSIRNQRPLVTVIYADAANCNSYHWINIYRRGAVRYKAQSGTVLGEMNASEHTAIEMGYQLNRNQLSQLVELIKSFRIVSNEVAVADFSGKAIEIRSSNDSGLLTQVHEHLTEWLNLDWYEFSNDLPCRIDQYRPTSVVRVDEDF